ncbi:60S ribosomal protein L37a [Lemmus lemmus]
MVKRTKKVRIVGKYRTRYGASLRKMVKKTEISQHAKYTCSCGKTEKKRQAVGIWRCGSACKQWLEGPGPQGYCLRSEFCPQKTEGGAGPQHYCCHSEVRHQKTEGTQRPAEVLPFETQAYSIMHSQLNKQVNLR